MLSNFDSILIICDGLLPKTEWIFQEWSQHPIKLACDGAGNQLLDMELIPDVIIGDLDSFDSTRKGNFKIIEDLNQETNDLEKALQFVFDNGAQKVIIIGAFGKRIDHTLKNLSVLMQFDPKFSELIIKDEFGISIMARNSIQIHAAIGTSVSMVPMSGKVEGIQTKGLEYPLNNEFIANGVRDGSSNKLTQEQATISIQSGSLLIVLGESDPTKYSIIRS